MNQNTIQLNNGCRIPQLDTGTRYYHLNLEQQEEKYLNITLNN